MLSGAQVRATAIGERIMARRLAAGLTREQLARHVGVTWRTVERWEHGKASPSKANLALTARAFGVYSETLTAGLR